VASASAWQQTQSAIGLAEGVAVDGSGDVFVTGGNRPTGDDSSFAITRYGADGTLVWQTALDGGPGAAQAGLRLALDGAGDVFATGTLATSSVIGAFAVVSLRASDGAEQWRRVIDPGVTGDPGGGGIVVGVHPSGDVLAAGTTLAFDHTPRITVVRLAAATGAVVWKHTVFGQAAVQAGVVTPDGDVVVGGSRGVLSSSSFFFLARIDGATGAEEWHYDAGLTAQNMVFDVTLDGAGQVLATGMLRNLVTQWVDFFTVKVSGATGSEIWRHTVPARQRLLDGTLIGGHGYGYRVVATPDGDAVASGSMTTGRDTQNADDMIIVRMRGADGSEMWRSSPGGAFNDLAYVSDVGPEGDILVSGVDTQDPNVGPIPVLLRLDGSTGEERWRSELPGQTVARAVLGGGSSVVFVGSDDQLLYGLMVGKIGWARGTLCGDGALDPTESCDDGNDTIGDGCDAACRPEKVVSAIVAAGGSVGTDLENDGATATDPIETTVTSPVGGTISVLETTPPVGVAGPYLLLGREVRITAPTATPEAPLTIDFVLDVSALAGEDEDTLVVFRNGVAVGTCTGAAGHAEPSPCITLRERLPDGDVHLRVLTAAASTWDVAAYTCEPASGCIGPVSPSKAKVQIKSVKPDRGTFAWKWTKGLQLAAADVTGPATSGSLAVCVFGDGDGRSPLLYWARAPGGGSCEGKPCWKISSGGVSYKDGGRSRHGLVTLIAKSDENGRGKIVAKASRDGFVAPDLPIEAVSLRIQLQSDDGTCWETIVPGLSAIQNDATRFKSAID
jgi:cysteine-rich repeat protein